MKDFRLNKTEYFYRIPVIRRVLVEVGWIIRGGKGMRANFPENISDTNMRLGVVQIGSLHLDENCRDSKIKVLRALQYIYMNPELRDQILELVGQAVNPSGESARKNGRPGMDYWQILVLASVRLGCDLTYDELHDLSCQHYALRVMLGFSSWYMNADDCELFTWHCIRYNVCKLPVETLKKISDVIVGAGHQLVPDAPEVVRGDSFVVGTNIHYPVDRRQLGDGVRKLIETCTILAESYNLTGWRKHEYLMRQNRKFLRGLSLASRSRHKNAKNRSRNLHLSYFAFVEKILERALETMEALSCKQNLDLSKSSAFANLTYYLSATEYMRELTVRRIVGQEVIPNEQKLFSIFEPHTELINRGKFPQAIEFGHRVLVIEDSAGFICHHEVMDIGMLDKDVLCQAMQSLQQRLGNKIRSASFDCGFHSPTNQSRLAKIISEPCLPVKGVKLAQKQREEASVNWHNARDYHAGIESAIHALRNGNGLDKCRDKAYDGYERYVALAVLGRNLCTLGRILLGEESENSNAAYTKRKAVNF